MQKAYLEQSAHIWKESQTRKRQMYYASKKPTFRMTPNMIEGFKMASLDPYPKYGTAIYIQEDILDYSVLTSIKVETTSITGINIEGMNIYNTYKPPGISWLNGTLPTIPKPSLIIGDFNSHNTTWGYSTVDEVGEVLEEWITCQDLHLIQDLKGPSTFWSARWKAGYNPDLTLITLDDDGIPLLADRTVIGDFPNSQHRLLLTKVSFNLHAYKSLPKIRWNFKKSQLAGLPKICRRDWESNS